MTAPISVLCLLCAGYLITPSLADRVSKPTIYDNSTAEQLVLHCASSSPSVTYEWQDSTGQTLSIAQTYIVPRPKEDLTLTCIVDNKVSQESQNITVPYSAERKGLSGCVIAWIVIGVIVGVIALLFFCIFCILSKFLGGGVNACMATGVLCCLSTCFCCKRNWKKGLHNLVGAVLPFIEEKMGMKDDAEKGEQLSSREEKAAESEDGGEGRKGKKTQTSD